MILAGAALAGCGGTPEPRGTLVSTAAESPIVEPASVPIDQVVGPWRPAPIDLDEPQIAIISDACAAAARELLGEAEANLPTALVDARGEGLATAILADDLLAIECLARTDGRTATIDSVFRLSATAVALVDESRITVARLVHEDDRDGGRTVAFGRVGQVPFMVKLGFDDESEIFPSGGEGWWAAWWPGVLRPATISAVDSASLVIGSAKSPLGQVEARIGVAAWWLDPNAVAPTAASTTVSVLVLEESCASGRTPEGRVEPPTIEITDTEVIVTFAIRKQPGGQDCQGNPPFPVSLKLSEPLGSRTLLDGSETPPRKVDGPPAG